MRPKNTRHLIAIVALIAILFPAGLRSETISLDGDWNFVIDPTWHLALEGLASARNIRTAGIPSSWQSQFADLRDYAGVAWYWRTARFEPVPSDRVVLLRFGAVDYVANVYVNGQKAGSHEGGYLPFEFDITSLIRSGDNQIAVRVADPGPTSPEVEGIRYAEIPHGKQIWYVETSGLWQSVELQVRPRMHVGTVHVTARADGSFNIRVPIVNPTPQTAAGEPPKLAVTVFDPAGRSSWETSQVLKASEADYTFAGRLSSPQLWSPDHPALYRLRVSMSSGDFQDIGFGFRTFETRDGKFYFNGKPIYLRGALDQDFYPETAYTPPSLEYLKNEMRLARALGLNLLRCHIKAPDPRYLQAADEVGVLIWDEIPNWDKLTEDSQRRELTTLRGMVERDWNHPCLVIVSLINESWGVDLREPADREWLKGAYTQAKALVQGWLVVDNSACCSNYHLATDIADFHEYAAIPDHAADFDRLVDDLARRPRWLFSPYGDATPKGDEPLVLSEFGNWGLPRLPDSKPWWFMRDFRGNPITLPEGVEGRFARYQYASLFPSVDGLTESTEWQEYQALKYEIESLRSHPEIQGYVITEFTDVNWESNGLMDMWRHPKIFADTLRKLQQDDLVVVQPESRSLVPGQNARAEVIFSHYSEENFAGAEVRWSVEGSPLQGSFPLPSLPLASCQRVGVIEFTAPSVSAPSQKVLHVEVTRAGKTQLENSVQLFIFPPKSPELPPPVNLYDPEGKLRRLVNEMRERGYQPPSGAESFPVLLTSVFDDRVKGTLRAGGRVILLASEPLTLTPELKVLRRAGSSLDGNWISSFPWVRKDAEPFKLIAFSPFAGFETQAVTPNAVVSGVPAEGFKDVLAGIFYGWIHSNVATLLQARAGKGKLLLCTFSLAATYGSDPYATYLLDALVNYIVSGPTPEYEIPL